MPAFEQSTGGRSVTGHDGQLDDRASEPVSVVALTVLYHSDPERIGERVVLGELAVGRVARLSRTEPEFSQPRSGPASALLDFHLSRTPIELSDAGHDGAVALAIGQSRTRVVAQGMRIRDQRTFTRTELADGVTLEFGSRVVLLLHRFVHAEPAPSDALGLVGESAPIARLRSDIQRVADLDVPVLIRGQSGTGKELVARAIHQLSPRRHKPMVAVNLGAIPPSLAISELFGSERGAFTGAARARSGFFRQAHGGTLFLDEVGEAPPELQTALLRVLETGQIHVLGGQAPQNVDVRIISATDTDLDAGVRDGSVRAPLLYRLAGYDLELAPLCERRDDIGRLLLHFLKLELQRIGESHQLDRFVDWLPADIVARLARYDWPGNVRELGNVTRQLVISGRGGDVVKLGPQLTRRLGTIAPAPSTSSPAASGAARRVDRRKPADISEDEMLAVLRDQRWDLKASARALRISRTSLYALVEACPHVRTAASLSDDELTACWQTSAGDLDAMVDVLQVSRVALHRRLKQLELL